MGNLCAPPADAQDNYELGTAAYDQGDYDAAEKYFLAEFRVNPKTFFRSEAFQYYATLLMERSPAHPGWFKRAEKIFQRCVEDDPDDIPFVTCAANLMCYHNRPIPSTEYYYRVALEALEVRMKRMMREKGVQSIHSTSTLGSGILDGSLDIAEETLRELPEGAGEVFFSYADFLEKRKKDFDKADVYYKTAIDYDNQNAAYIFAYAKFLRNSMGNEEKARDMVELAKVADPEYMSDKVL
eukprot:GFYU01025590.1.p1 GENE.GFYU01025590.1~~GFYU01025590.1.p1  ORF type:complete len:240 (+),score=61.80 GFYU01025590.1:117-836(+)